MSSAYKVISNYYTDLLDYISVINRKYNSLSEFKERGTLNEKKDLIDKIASIYQRFDILKKSQQLYWKNKAYTSMWYMIIFIIIIFIITIIFVFVGITQYMDLALFTDKIIFILTMLIVYDIIFGIFFMLILNNNENRLQSKRLGEEAVSDIINLKNLMKLESLETMFLFIAYKKNENIQMYNKIYKENNISYSYINHNTNPGVSTVSANIKPIDSFNYDKFFNDNTKNNDNGIIRYLDELYDNGNGYLEIRKQLVASSNILILKEFNRLMMYYYKLIRRKDNITKLDQDQEQKIINNYVVPVLKNINKIKNKTNIYITPTVKNNSDTTSGRGSISINLSGINTSQEYISKLNQFDQEDFSTTQKNPTFLKQYENLLYLYSCCLLYFSQINNERLYNSSDDAFEHLPNNTTLPSAFDDNYKFIMNVKNTFITLDKNFNIKDNAYSQLSLLNDLFLEQYSNLVSTLDSKINYYYFFDPIFMKFQITEAWNNSNYNQYITNGSSEEDIAKTSTYIDSIIQKFVNNYLPDYYNSFVKSINIDSQVSKISSNIAQNIMSFNINITNYIGHIISEVKKSTAIDASVEALITRIIKAVKRDIEQKKLGAIEFTNKNDDRFLTQSEFIDLIDNMSYSDIAVGLNYNYMNVIASKFYYDVSNSVYAEDKKSKDIYFYVEKKFKLGKSFVVFTNVALGISLFYIIINAYNDSQIYKGSGPIFESNLQKYRDDIKEQKEKVDLYLEGVAQKTLEKNNEYYERLTDELQVREDKLASITNGYQEEYINIFLRNGVYCAVVIFLICLIISIFYKAKAKYKFNRETIDNNTAELKTSIQRLNNWFDENDQKLGIARSNKYIKDLNIDVDSKIDLYNILKKIVDSFEKCNYILGVQRAKMTFPYTEVFINSFMIIVALIALIYMISRINPIERMRELKVLYGLIEEVNLNENTYEWRQKVKSLLACHKTDMDNICNTGKLVFILFIVIFLIFYSTKVILSSTEFEYSLYNSIYFEQSMCFDYE